MNYTNARFRLLPLLLGLLLVPVSESAAQAQWQQTVQVIAPVEDGTVTRALMDSVMTVLETNSVPVQQSPQSDTTSLRAIQDNLSGEGLALTSATHVFITYRYNLTSSDLQREILDLYFIYRPSAQQEEDIPVLYVDLSRDNLYEEVMVKRGTTLPSNEAAFLPFNQQLGFHNLRDVVTVVQVGDEIIRDPERAAVEKKRLLKITQNLTYNRL